MVQGSNRAAEGIQALLGFAPVARKCVRRDGWTPERQRGFVAVLAATGSADQAAQAVGLTARGAYDLRKQAGAGEFRRAWEGALAHWDRIGTAGTRASGPAGDADGASAAAADAALEKARQRRARTEALLHAYRNKVQEERQARLEGRIVEADFCVRQITCLEIALELGGKGPELMFELRKGDLEIIDIAATPLSVLLHETRRSVWRERGEPDRPQLPPLGIQQDGVALGESQHHWAPRDGDYREWRRRQDAERALAAEAQTAWEDKARADVAAWAARAEGEKG